MTTGGMLCEQVLATDLKLAEGLEISRHERELYVRHLAGCESCRAERKALDTLSSGPPSGVFDDIARRRYVDQVLQRYEEPAGDDLLSRGSGGRISRMKLAGLAAALAMAAAVALVIAVATQQGRDDPADADAVPAMAPALEGRIVLVAGDADATDPALVGDRVKPGRRLTCGASKTVLSLPTGITVSLAPGSRASTRRLDGDALQLELHEGSLLAAATPGRSGPPFEVFTRSGVITVTGTVLAVEDSGRDVEVRVIRGRVMVDDGVGRKPRPLGPAEATVLGRPAVRTASPEETAAVWREISSFDLLDPGAGGVVDVSSIPAGAEVTIDGVSLGRTPVVAAVRAGHRRLELNLAGRVPVREFVDVSDGETLARAFDLQTTGPEIATAASDAGVEIVGASVPAAAAGGPADVLVRAQELRAARDWAGAARAYRELIRRFAGSAEANSATVSLAQIELGKLGKPGKALDRFDAYLSRHPAGPLALEALFGRARALRALGRTGEEREALERFVARFPNALQAQEARQRLAAIEAADQG